MTDKTVRSVVDIDAPVYWKLAGLAEAHSMTVPQYLAELAVVASRAKRPLDADPVVFRWRQGMTDKQIAHDLNMTNSAVADRRRSFRLPANRKKTAA